MACDVPERCKFSSHDSFARRDSCGSTRKLNLLRTQSLVVLQVGDAERFPRALVFESLDPLSSE